MKIIIFGAGGQAKETIDLIRENVKAQIIGIVNKQNINEKILGYKFLGTDDQINKIIKKNKATHFFAAIGDLKIRNRIYNTTKKSLKPLTIISKKANLSKFCKFGDHVIIYPGVTINAEVTIGNNNFINSNVSIGHESQIGNHININPGVNIAGKVIINDFCTIGIGASIKENLRISQNTVVGAGAVVVKNTLPNKTYIGIPAKIMTPGK